MRSDTAASPRDSTPTRPDSTPPEAVDPRGSAAIALLALAASATSLLNGFTYDDRLLILQNPRVHHLAHLGRLWAETYWPPWMGAGLYRPLTMSAFTVEWFIGRGAPWVFHATNVVLYITVSILVYALAVQLLPRAAAWIAAALFAVHPVHVEAVGNVVGQSELWAACAVVAAVVAYVRWRRSAIRAQLSSLPQDGVVRAAPPGGDAWRRTYRLRAGLWLPPFSSLRSPFSAAVAAVARELGADEIGGGPHLFALVALVIGGCLAKEHAVVTPALLAIAEVCVIDDPRPLRERWRALRPLALLLAAAVIAYVAVRTNIVGAFAGDRPNVVLEHLSPAARRWTMLGIVGEWVRLLAWPWHLVVEYAPRDIRIHEHFDLSLIPNAVLLALFAVLLVLSLLRHWVAAFGLLWVVVAMLLVSNLIVPTGVLLAERTLFLPSVGAVLIAGAAVAGLARSAPSMAMWYRRGRRGLILAAPLALLLVVGAWRSARRQLVWRSNAALFAQAPLDAPLSYRAHDVYAGLLFDRGDAAGGEREARLALALYPHDPVLYRDLAQEYMRAGLCTAAIPLLRRSIAEPGAVETDAHLLLAECLLAQHDPRSARDEVLRGVAHGSYHYYGAGYHKVLLAVDSALTRPAGADAGSAHAAEHRPVSGIAGVRAVDVSPPPQP